MKKSKPDEDQAIGACADKAVADMIERRDHKRMERDLKRNVGWDD
jgi:hypothetical protein